MISIRSDFLTVEADKAEFEQILQTFKISDEAKYYYTEMRAAMG